MRSIPPASGLERPLAAVLEPMIENVRRITGQLPKVDRIEPLPTGATTAQIIAKINEIIERLQG